MGMRNYLKQLDKLHIPWYRYNLNPHYTEATDLLYEDEEHWLNTENLTAGYGDYLRERISLAMKRIARHQVAGGHDRGWGSYEKLSERGEKLVDLLVTEEHSREFPLLTKRLNGAHFGIVILRPLNPSIQVSRLYHLRALDGLGR
jgi:hypothetical protein